MPTSDKDRIVALEARIAQLEARLAQLELRPQTTPVIPKPDSGGTSPYVWPGTIWNAPPSNISCGV